MAGSVVEALDRELTLLVARTRDLTPARWAAPACPFGSRADVAFHLAAVLAIASGAPVPLPRLASPMVLPDQLMVVGHDLMVAAVTDAVLARALAEVLLHRYDVDGAAPGKAAAARVLAVLVPDAPVEAFLGLARAWCAAQDR